MQKSFFSNHLNFPKINNQKNPNILSLYSPTKHTILSKFLPVFRPFTHFLWNKFTSKKYSFFYLIIIIFKGFKKIEEWEWKWKWKWTKGGFLNKLGFLGKIRLLGMEFLDLRRRVKDGVDWGGGNVGRDLAIFFGCGREVLLISRVR